MSEERSAAHEGPAQSEIPFAVQQRLAERRRWFANFPYGAIEFVAVVRIVWILLFLALPFVGGMRTYVSFMLAFLLLTDGTLVVGWLTQRIADRDCVRASGPATPCSNRRAHMASAATLFAQFLLAAFTLSFLNLPFDWFLTHPHALIAGRWVVLGAYAAAACVALVACRRAGLGSRVSSVLFVVPILCWWPARRFAADLGRSLIADMDARAARHAGLSGPAFLCADALWSISVVVVALVLLTGGFRADQSWRGLCSGMLVALASIADVAALESVQEVYCSYLRALRPRSAK